MTRQRVEVLLAVRALEPNGYGESVRLYLKHRGVVMRRAPVYRQLQELFRSGYLTVARQDGTREHLATTPRGRQALHAWVRQLCRIAGVT